MSISGKQTINIGLPNESVGSDSLYTAFTKSQTNFDTLFACASPYSTITAGNGINVNANSSTGIVSITNSGVTNIIAGTNIVVSGANGNVTISSTGGGGGNGTGTVTSIGVKPVSTDRLTTTGSPVISSGNINIDLAVIANITPATYTNPNVTIDAYGRVTAVSNGASAGSVTSVGLTPGTGIQINGGPITTNGNITVTNIGVTRVTAGTGILVSGSNGNVTISSTSSGGTVTAVGVSSGSLVVSGSPVVNSGTISVELPQSAPFRSVQLSEGLYLSGGENLASGAAANIYLTASYFTTTGASTATLGIPFLPGVIKTFMMVADGGDMVITVSNAGWKTSGTGTITFNDIGDGCTLQYINSKWYAIGINGVVFA
jgi:hypothetical protein